MVFKFSMTFLPFQFVKDNHRTCKVCREVKPDRSARHRRSRQQHQNSEFRIQESAYSPFRKRSLPGSCSCFLLSIPVPLIICRERQRDFLQWKIHLSVGMICAQNCINERINRPVQLKEKGYLVCVIFDGFM